jgi:hypothetical protein
MDATSTVYSGIFVEEEGTLSSLRGVRETIEAKGLFSSFYSDRGSHYWFVALMGIDIREILCIQEPRTVRADNCHLQRQDAADPGAQAPVPLRQGQGAGPRVSGSAPGDLPRTTVPGSLYQDRPTSTGSQL